MNFAAELPARMTCLLCFSPQSMERRYDKRGKPYTVCGLCHGRVFLANDTQIFGMIFWAKALADENLVRAARADLEKALQMRGAKDTFAVPLPVANHSPAPIPAPLQAQPMPAPILEGQA